MPGGNEPTTPVDHRRVRVLAVDDHPPFRVLLHDLVRETRHLEVVAEAQCGEQAVELARELRPEMILMDVRMPGLGGLEAARLIKASDSPSLIVLVSTAHPDELPLDLDDTVAEAVIWKSELEPTRLDEIWEQYRGPGAASAET